jgi:hypothetical protein
MPDNKASAVSTDPPVIDQISHGGFWQLGWRGQSSLPVPHQPIRT